jgi:hypothetical protein
MVSAVRSRPVMSTRVSPMRKSNPVPSSTDGVTRVPRPVAAGLRIRPRLAAVPVSARPLTNVLLVGIDPPSG